LNHVSERILVHVYIVIAMKMDLRIRGNQINKHV